MGSGKSTHGKKLASFLKREFLDLDEFIVSKYQMSIDDLFELKGETEFRNIESNELTNIINLDKAMVVSLGGGTPCFNNNIELIKRSGLLVYIQMDAKSLANRLMNAKSSRPLIKNKSNDELLNFITDSLKNREIFYNQAHVLINGINLDEQKIYKAIQDYMTKS
jgi:shikimate kinase